MLRLGSKLFQVTRGLHTLRATQSAAAAAATSSENIISPPQKVNSSKVWTSADTTADDLRVQFPEAMHREVYDYVHKVKNSVKNVDELVAPENELPETAKFLRELEKNHIDNGRGCALLPKVDGLESVQEMRLATFTLTTLMGTPLEQNAEHQKHILVYDRDSARKMADGQRYHQSHEGGQLHTDNVNVPDVWESMFLTCLQPAHVGGESIVVSVNAVHNYMVEHMPDSVEELQRDFLFEFRGFSDKFYKAPLLYYNRKGEACFRYLRSYMESAHTRLNKPLSIEQKRALDLIDCIGELSQFQVRAQFQKGETLWCNDVQLLHGRTSFIDSGKAELQYNLDSPQNRLYMRTWISTKNEDFRGINQSKYTVIDN